MTNISVVVPVYNPGEYIEPCIRSILGQTMSADRYEAIFVDDGSTDETPARLDALAREHPNVRVFHQPNSGWPGRPRNVGIDAARGEFVFFCDQDDWLGEEALERMYEMATRNDSDVLVPKMAGHGRRVPRMLFVRNRDHATLDDTPLIDGLTPHKLFRKDFLDEHGIRFPEGRRRLEDHPFVLRSYFLARSISVLGDYVCYYHTRRPDLENAGLRRLDPAGYYGNLREVLAIVEEYTEPGPRRDRVLLRFARSELLERLRGRQFLDQPEDYRAELYAQIRAVVLDHIPESVDARLAPTYRVEMALLRSDRRDLVEAFAEAVTGIRPTAKVSGRAQLRDGHLVFRFRGGLTQSGGLVSFDRRDGRWLIHVPPAVAAAVPDASRTIPGEPKGTVWLLVRRQADSAEIVFPPKVETHVVDVSPESAELQFGVEVALPVASINGGLPLQAGSWVVFARFEQAGYGAEKRLPVGPIVVDTTGAVAVTGAVTVTPSEARLREIYESLPPRGRRLARTAYAGIRMARVALNRQRHRTRGTNGT